MQYRTDKYGNRLSVLGYGCMRFTQKAGRVDLEKAREEKEKLSSVFRLTGRPPGMAAEVTIAQIFMIPPYTMKVTKKVNRAMVSPSTESRFLCTSRPPRRPATPNT